MVEAINTQNLTSLDEFMAPDLVLHMHGEQTQGWEVNKRGIEEEIKAFPDFHIAIEDIIAEEGKVWVRFTETGTHTGDYRGLAPTGNTLSYTVVTI
jgi:predicted ester cyclase